MITATRFHDFSAGHRVHEHESKCRNLHGHNYRVHFTVQAEKLDTVGRVMDFSAIKSKLCQWVEDNWDHRFLIWDADPKAKALTQVDATVVIVPFNPTAENMADFLLRRVGPVALAGTGVTLVAVNIEETRKCSAVSQLDTQVPIR